MGLCLCADGYIDKCNFSYSGFNEFRKKIAASLGFDLEEMVGFRKKHIQDEGYIKIGYHEWYKINSPLKHLLSHCDDCDNISSAQCKVMAPILKKIILLWEKEFCEHLIAQGFTLIKLMEYCATYDKELIFC